MANRIIIVVLGLFAFMRTVLAQRFCLFTPEVKREYPSVVYDFLERYLFQIDSLQQKGERIDQLLLDDKVYFVVGKPAIARTLTPVTPFSISKTDNKFYEVQWTDTLGNVILSLAFPMQYELLLDKTKVEIEQEFKQTLSEERIFVPCKLCADKFANQEDKCMMTEPTAHYQIESVNNATYYRLTAKGDTIPVFDSADKWHSAANIFQGCISNISDYTLYIEQNMYGFKKSQYTIPLQQWLAYCKDMQLTTYFAIEEEREDGLKALLIAQSQDLGFNHMMSIIIPDNFVTNPKTVFKATLNAYIPTQNVKNLYQQYVDRPKKKI